MSAYRDKLFTVAGLGQTGWSCICFLRARGARVRVTDTRDAPPMLAQLRAEFPEVEFLPGLAPQALEGAAALIVSPGLDLRLPFFSEAEERGIRRCGDIELFAREARAPVIAITGANGKSTVTTLVGQMAKKAGKRVAMGGNLGTPALDLLADVVDLYVLELSSFQLELTESLNAAAAVVLNISPDHIDRHGTLERYAEIKARVYRGNGAAVINRDDPVVSAMAPAGRPVSYFSLTPMSAENEYSLCGTGSSAWLCRGREELVALSSLRIKGRHNAANALAALALGELVGLDRKPMLDALREFPGLPHRCEWVAERNGVNWYNDSKGTNVGATLAALSGMPGPIVLLAGGLAKGGDFRPLKSVLREKGRAVVLFGQDAPLIEQAITGAVPLRHANSMDQAVREAADAAQPGDTVLLSPGCASFDMFTGYEQRGQKFVEAVGALS